MNGSSPANRFGSFFYWLLESFGMRTDIRGEKSRLATLGAKTQQTSDPQVCQEVADAVRAVVSDRDKDNYLRGQLIHENHSESERHNRRTVEHWLHGDDLETALKNSSADSELEDEAQYEPENRLASTGEISLGLGLECLTSFVGDLYDKNEATPNSMKKTVQDLPAMQFDFKRVELIHADAADRQINKCE